MSTTLDLSEPERLVVLAALQMYIGVYAGRAQPAERPPPFEIHPANVVCARRAIRKLVGIDRWKYSRAFD
jgi:hypothetical protein